MDPLKNLKEVIVSGTYSAVDTAITLSSGEGAKLPDPAVEGEYNLPWYNSTDYVSPAADPNAEFVRAISISGDVLIVQRPEVGNDYNGEDDENIASTKSVAGKVYKMQMAWSMKSIADVDIANAPATSAMEDTDEIGFWDTVLEKLTKITWADFKAEILSYILSVWDSWLPSSSTYVYASAQSMTIEGINLTSVFTKGTKIKLTNDGSDKYFYVTASSFSTDTTVALTGEVDLVNSAITLPFYSYADNPQGFKRAEDWYKCTLTITANQIIADNSYTKIDFEASDNPNGDWNNSTNEFTAPISGYYTMTAGAVRAGGNYWKRAFIEINGASGGSVRGVDITSASTKGTNATQMSSTVRVEKGDTVEFRIFADVDAGSPQIDANSVGAIQFLGL